MCDIHLILMIIFKAKIKLNPEVNGVYMIFKHWCTCF